MNMFEKMREKKKIARLNQLKQETRTVDAKGMLKLMMEDVPKMSKEDREGMRDCMEKAFEENGKKVIERGLLEGLFSEKEWKEWQKKYNFDNSDFGSVLNGVFIRQDKPIKGDDEIIIVSTQDSEIYKARDFLQKRFKVIILDAEEGLKKIQKGMSKKEKAEFEEFRKKEMKAFKLGRKHGK